MDNLVEVRDSHGAYEMRHGQSAWNLRPIRQDRHAGCEHLAALKDSFRR